jgi:TetR/AcrR family transcriptional regulator
VSTENIPEINQTDSASRILEAALALFAEKGFDATSIREICEAAGITRPTLYYFYESKEGLYRAAIEYVMCHCQENTELARQGITTLRGTLKQVMRSVFADVVARPKIWRLFFQIIWSHPHPITQTVFQQYHREYYEEIEADQRAAIERGEISEGNTRVRALVFMGAVGECIANHISMGQPELTPELADNLVDTIFEGWTPRDSGRSRDLPDNR